MSKRFGPIFLWVASKSSSHGRVRKAIFEDRVWSTILKSYCAHSTFAASQTPGLGNNRSDERETRMANDISDIIDLDAYPIDQLNNPRRAELVAHCQNHLDSNGCLSLPDFVCADQIEAIRQMYQPLLPGVFRPTDLVSPYGAHADDDTFPEDHPRRFRFERGGGFVGADEIPDDCALWTIIRWDALTAFLREVLRTDALYPYADPIASMAANVMWEDHVFPWHYDTNEFTVSIMVQAPDAGGQFQYFPNSRTPTDDRFDTAKRVFDGDTTGMKTLDLEPGDMQLFKGRYSLHQVSAIQGATPRIVALPSWSSVPGQVGVVDRMLKSYGRALPIHYERAGQSPDGLTQ